MKFNKLLLALSLLAVSIGIQAKEADEQTLDRTVAIVNSDIITESEFNRQYQMIVQRLSQQQPTLPSEAELKKQILDKLIDRKIQLQTAARSGIELSSIDLAHAMENVAQTNHLTMDELKESITSDGVNFEDFQNHVREQLIIERLLGQQVASRISITNEEVEHFLNSQEYQQGKDRQYLLSDILLALPEEPSANELHQAKQTADAILAQLKNGTPFQQIALSKSEGQAALSGGDLGWRRMEEIPSAFASKVLNLKQGEIAGPIRTSNGLHIIKLEEVRDNNQKHIIPETLVQHILLKRNQLADDEELQQRLLQLRQRIANGEDFNEVAKNNSQDLNSAVNGGSLGWIKPGQLVPQFEQAMDKLELGELSQPVATQFGWHLIQVLKRRETDDTEDYEKQQVRKLIYQQHYEQDSQAWIKRMRDASYVKILVNV